MISYFQTKSRLHPWKRKILDTSGPHLQISFLESFPFLYVSKIYWDAPPPASGSPISVNKIYHFLSPLIMGISGYNATPPQLWSKNLGSRSLKHLHFPNPCRINCWCGNFFAFELTNCNDTGCINLTKLLWRKTSPNPKVHYRTYVKHDIFFTHPWIFLSSLHILRFFFTFQSPFRKKLPESIRLASFAPPWCTMVTTKWWWFWDCCKDVGPTVTYQLDYV